MRSLLRFTLVALLLHGAAVRASAEEAIISFAAEVLVRKDSSLVLTETFQARSEADKIKRGLCRGVIWERKNSKNIPQKINYEVVSVQRNGEPSPWVFRDVFGSKVLCTGNQNVRLPAGVHSYVLQYKVSNAILREDEEDRLELDLTGFLPIPAHTVGAVVRFPKEIAHSMVKVEGAIDTMKFDDNTGEESVASEKDSVTITPITNDPDYTSFQVVAKRALKESDRVSVSLRWPKGHIDRLVTAVVPGAEVSVEGEDSPPQGKAVVVPGAPEEAPSSEVSSGRAIAVPEEPSTSSSESASQDLGRSVTVPGTPEE